MQFIFLKMSCTKIRNKHRKISEEKKFHTLKKYVSWKDCVKKHITWLLNCIFVMLIPFVRILRQLRNFWRIGPLWPHTPKNSGINESSLITVVTLCFTSKKIKVFSTLSTFKFSHLYPFCHFF
jgi:hypothetical protein